MFVNTKLYAADYASDLLRGIELEPRPWDIQQIILTKINTDTRLLDIGSGDARKMFPMTSYVKHISAMEPSPAIQQLAANKIQIAKINNISLVNGKAAQLPFLDKSVDMVTCMLAPWDWGEITRVLKPNGWFINETIGCEDKLTFKKAFGKDQAGYWRGQRISLNNQDCLALYKAALEPHFTDIKITSGYWNTFYTKAGLLQLCQLTPTISHFDLEKDKIAFNAITDELMTKAGIKLKQNRILMIGQKK